MDDRTPASLHEIADGYHQRLAELRKMQQDVQNVTATARTRDGAVSVEVGAQGDLRAVHLGPRVYDRMNPQRLALTIMELAGEATREASGRARQITAALLPEDVAARLRDGEEDLSAFLPDAPSFKDDLPD
ncbi:YbaB/EbfC family nucleoid-associated protein [Actinoallomurus acaciae]|uniref:YbaB/EbfC family nucleoid-associated protein n=1 Tax=Actinoallomurus acaciae TaxID=502577 RepID=A0ABV5YBW2_9ACTN